MTVICTLGGYRFQGTAPGAHVIHILGKDRFAVHPSFATIFFNHKKYDETRSTILPPPFEFFHPIRKFPSLKIFPPPFRFFPYPLPPFLKLLLFIRKERKKSCLVVLLDEKFDMFFFFSSFRSIASFFFLPFFFQQSRGRSKDFHYPPLSRDRFLDSLDSLRRSRVTPIYFRGENKFEEIVLQHECKSRYIFNLKTVD